MFSYEPRSKEFVLVSWWKSLLCGFLPSQLMNFNAGLMQQSIFYIFSIWKRVCFLSDADCVLLYWYFGFHSFAAEFWGDFSHRCLIFQASRMMKNAAKISSYFKEQSFLCFEIVDGGMWGCCVTSNFWSRLKIDYSRPCCSLIYSSKSPDSTHTKFYEAFFICFLNFSQQIAFPRKNSFAPQFNKTFRLIFFFGFSCVCLQNLISFR